MSQTSSRIKTILPTSSRTALGATVATGLLTALASAPERLTRLLRDRYPMVAVTGMTGVGKSQLVDRLTRRAADDATVEVGSATMERRTRRGAKLHGFRFLVVPGDNAATRLSALDEVFHDEPVDGVIHVVANGHATPRRAAGTTGEATATREEQLAAELEDWAITSHRIYPDDVDAVVRYYSPGSGSPFAARVDALRALAGGAKLSIDVLPVSSETGDRTASTSDKRANAMVDALAGRLGQLSGHA